MKRLLSLPVLLTLVLSATACADFGGSRRQQEEGLPSTVEIGVIAPLTGASAGGGEDIERGARLAETMINESGVLGDTELKVVIEDDQTDPTAATAAAESLYRKGIRMFAGGASSGPNQATLNVLSRYDDVVSVGCGCSTSDIEKEYGQEDWVFFTYPWAYNYQEAAVEFLENLEPAAETVGILHSTTPYGEEQAAIAIEKLKSNGIVDIVATEKFDESGTDLTPALTNIKRAQPDVLYIIGYTNDSILATRQARSLDVGADLILGTPQMGTSEYEEALGADAEKVTFVSAWEPTAEFPAAEAYPEIFPATEDFVARYENEYKRPPTSLTMALSYVPIATLAIAMAEEGTTDTGELAGFLAEDYSTMTPMGNLEFTPSEDAKYHGFSDMGVYQWIKGEKHFVMPGEEGAEPVQFEE